MIVRAPCTYPIARDRRCGNPAIHAGLDGDKMSPVCDRHRGSGWSGNRTAWTHNVCERCWFSREPERFPVMLKRPDGDYDVDQCCFCGTITISRIYTREDPRSDDLICECRDDG